LGDGNLNLLLKSGTKGTTDKPFAFGDNMMYIGFATINGKEYTSLAIEKRQVLSETLVLNFEVTAILLPTIITDSISKITFNSAVCGGKVISEGSDAITSKGICWATTPNPTITNDITNDGIGPDSFVSTLTGLTEGTLYYVRAYAVNSGGVAYGEEQNFTTLGGKPCSTAPLVVDNDRNIYNTVQIGDQCWMRENLKTTTYSDGMSIKYGKTSSDDVSYWCYPGDAEDNKEIYGLLYNWKAVMRNSASSENIPSGVQGICPIGWHVPSSSEWSCLTTYIRNQKRYWCDGRSACVAKAYADTIYWPKHAQQCFVGDDLSTNNATGFSARPAGYQYGLIGRAYFWSSTRYNSDDVDISLVLESSSPFTTSEHKSRESFFSVRCLKDD
jgi:uncharacterized protein (TIGR02145 family)